MAIALRFAPSGNTSRVVTWLTPGHGKVATILKGALRPKSPFLGQYDLFYTCELIFYQRAQRDVMITRECCPMRLRNGLRNNWRACLAASYFSDLIGRISPARAPQTALYSWLELALNELDAHGVSSALFYWTELRLLRQLGLAPYLDTCMACRSPLAAGKDSAFFTHERGGLLCARCAQLDRKPAVPIPPDVLAILRHWQTATAPNRARRFHCTPRQVTVMERLLSQFMKYHLDLPLPSRDIATAHLYDRHEGTTQIA